MKLVVLSNCASVTQIVRHMAQHTRQSRWDSNHVGKLEKMLKELGFNEDEVLGPNEDIEHMDIDTRLEVDFSYETGCANIASDFEPMEVDKDADVCIERWPINISESRLKKKILYKRKLTRIASLSRRLVEHDPIGTFADNCEKTLPDWIALLRKATLPNGITSGDPRIITAFKAVDNVICGQGTDLLQRLANVQLMRLFNSLEGIIKADRDNGRIHREPYYRDANIAMDIYLGAQDTQVDTKELRLKLRQGRKRFSKRWSHLAEPSPLFVLVYSNAAELIVDFKKTDNPTLRTVMSRVLRMCPDQLVRICARIDSEAEAVVRSNGPLNTLLFSAAHIRRSLAHN